MASYLHLTTDKLQAIWRTKQDDIRTILLSISVSILTSLAFNAFILSNRPSQEQYQQETSFLNQTKDPPPLPIPPPLLASSHTHDRKHHLLLCATGSVATIKLPLIATTLLSRHGASNLSIRILLTPSAATFLQYPSSSSSSSTSPSSSSSPSPLQLLSSTPGIDGIYFDEDEWLHPWSRGSPILHIELRRWADLMVIAPLSANSLSKIAMGSGEGLVASVVRAWDWRGGIDGVRDLGRSPLLNVGGEEGERRIKRIIVAPAMNTAMWTHPVTGKHLRVLEEEWGVDRDDEDGEGKGWIEVLRPVEKTLACGDTGGGAMREWSEIVEVVESRLGLVVGGGGEGVGEKA